MAARPTTQEALIYLMVIASASDRDMTDVELARIGEVVRSWPVFEGFDDRRIIAVAQDCQKLLQRPEGLNGVMSIVAEAVPERLGDTAYAAALEVAAVDLELRLEEVRLLQLLRQSLDLDQGTSHSIERAAKARHRTLA
jgi:tellurite resistance protein